MGGLVVRRMGGPGGPMVPIGRFRGAPCPFRRGVRFGEEGGRYSPPLSSVLEKSPKPGTFYRPRKGITPATVAEVAYGKAGRKAGLLAMNRSTWNDHVRRAKTGWEAYGVPGLQFEARYSSTDPLATYGSGSSFPVIWVPPVAGGEPESIFGAPAPVPAPEPIPPGGGGGAAAPLPPAPKPGPGGLPPPWVDPAPPAPPAPSPTPPAGPGYISGRYVPTSDMILQKSPKPGTFYRPRKGITPATVAEVAYGKKFTHTGLMLMNKSTWNDHVRRAAAGWTSYKVKGLQFEARYGAHPSSTYNTGKNYPVIWVPPLDGSEPEKFFGAKPPAPTPGPITPPVPPVGPVVPPYVPPEPPYVPPYVPPEPPPYVPPYVPPEPPYVPPEEPVPPDGPVPPQPVIPEPEPPAPPSTEKKSVIGPLAIISLLSFAAKEL